MNTRIERGDARYNLGKSATDQCVITELSCTDLLVYSVPTGQVVPTSGQVVDSTCECSGVSTTDFYQLIGSVQLKLLNDSCSTKLPLPRNPPLLEM